MIAYRTPNDLARSVRKMPVGGAMLNLIRTNHNDEASFDFLKGR